MLVMPKKTLKPKKNARTSLLLVTMLSLLGLLAVGTLFSAVNKQSNQFDTRSEAAPPITLIYPVAQLPSDNLIKNPWFRNENCTAPALSPWVSVPNLPDHSWTASDKPSNPSPSDGCATSARISVGEDGLAATVKPNQDVKMYQIVAANPAQKNLVFDMYWVIHTANYTTVNVYGGQSADPNGSWTKVWTPFNYSINETLIPPSGVNQSWIWKCYSEHYPECGDAPQLPATTTLSTGYPYYKIEFSASLPPVTGGHKLTGVYFATTGAGGIPPAPSVLPSGTPKISPTPSGSFVPPMPSVRPEPTVPPQAGNDKSRRCWFFGCWDRVRDSQRNGNETRER